MAEKILGRARRGYQYGLYTFNVRRLVRRPESVRIDRPIFILGVQGGGVTVLARTLYRHPQAVYATGNSRYWAGIDEIHNCPHIRDLPDPLVHRSYHFGNVDSSVVHHPRYGYQRSWLYAIDEFLPLYRRGADDVDPETTRRFRRVLQKAILAYAPDPDDARFVDMSQLYTIQVPYLARMLQDCDPRFVLVSRNPYVTCARAAAKEFGPEKGSYIGDDRKARNRCVIEHWSNSYRLALEAAAQGVPLLPLRYEDFLARPEAIVRRICQFAALEFHPRQVPAPDHSFPIGSLEASKWYPLRPAENALYLKDIDPELVEGLNERAGNLVERLGYERLEPRRSR